MIVCKECRNCDWFWEERNSDQECLGEKQPCEKYKPLRNCYKNKEDKHDKCLKAINSEYIPTKNKKY